MQPHGDAPNTADELTIGVHLVSEDPLLGLIKLGGEAVCKSVYRLTHLPRNHFEQGRGSLYLEASAQRLLGCFDRIQLMPSAGNEHRLGQHKVQKTNLLSDTLKPADEISKNAVNASVASVQLLVFIARHEQRLRGRSKNRVV